MGFFQSNKQKTRNAWDSLEHTKLALPLMEIRILEFCQVELLASVWLHDADIEYAALDRMKSWIVLIGAQFAMQYAEASKEIITDRKEESIPNVFGGFIRQGIPNSAYMSIVNDIVHFQRSEKIMELKKQLKSRYEYSDFQANCFLLAEYVCASIANDGSDTERITNSLYNFYLRAKNDYFQTNEPQ